MKAAMLCVCLMASGVVGAQESSEGDTASSAELAFVPEKAFPADPLLYLSFDGAALTRSARQTLIGEIIEHDAWPAVFSLLSERLREGLSQSDAAAKEAVGATPAELLDLLGSSSLVVRNVVPPFVEAALAIKVGSHREVIDRVLIKLRKEFEESTGRTVTATEVDGYQANVWPTPAGPLFQSTIGGHELFVFSREMFRSLIRGYLNDGAGPSLANGELMKSHPRIAGMKNRGVTCLVDLLKLRGIVFPMLRLSGGPEAEQAQQILRITGLNHATSFALAAGGHESFDTSITLGMSGGARGVLEAISALWSKVEVPDAAFEMIPANTVSVSACRIALPYMLRKVDALLRRELPESTPDIDELYATIEAKTGVSVIDELFKLPPLGALSYDVPPPAGGMFVDRVMLIRTDELEPYWSLLERVVKPLEARVQSIDTKDGKISYVNFLSGVAARQDAIAAVLSGSEPDADWVPGVGLLLWTLAVPTATVARVDRPDGWTAIATQTQTLMRFLSVYEKAPKLASGEFHTEIRRVIRGSSGAMVSRASQRTLASYNSAIHLLSRLSPLLLLVGVDVQRAPPAESFTGAVRNGFARSEVSDKRWSFYSRNLLDVCPGGIVGVGAVVAAIGFFLG